MKCTDAVPRISKNTSSWMGVDTGYLKEFILGIILDMLVSVTVRYTVESLSH